MFTSVELDDFNGISAQICITMLYYRLNLLNQNQAQLIAAELMAAA